MPEIHFADGLEGYLATSELEPRWLKSGTAATRPALSGHGRAGRRSIRTANQAGRSVAAIRTPDAQRIGVHFRVRFPGAAPGYSVGGLLAIGSIARLAAYADQSSTSASYPGLMPVDLLTISTDGSGVMRVENAVQTSAASGVSAMSRLVLAGGPGIQFAADTLYDVDVLLDVSNATAHAVVIVDGVTILDAAYNRNRVAPYGDVKVDLLQYVAFGGSSAGASANGAPHFSDIVIYDPTAEMTPIGPVAVDYYPAIDPEGIFAGPVNDAETVRIEADVEYPIIAEGADPEAGEILGAYVVGRSIPAKTEETYRFLLGSKTSMISFGETEVGPISVSAPQISHIPVMTPELTDMSQLADVRLVVRPESGS